VTDGTPDEVLEDERLRTETDPDQHEVEEDEYEDDSSVSGEEAGELVAGGSSDPFFISKQAAAVFKHRLLNVYFPKFAGKAGSNEPDSRLVYVDTHAGRGAYDDGTPGSPLLIAQNAAGMSRRDIDCIFIEKSRSNHAKLSEVLTEAVGDTVKWQAWRGRAGDRIDEAVAYAGDAPLFVFIDPYGKAPSLDAVAAILNRPRRGWGRKTEVLLNFISGSVARAGGYLHIEQPNAQQVTTLKNLDTTLGGPWWREVYLSADSPSDAVKDIGTGYAKRVKERTGVTWSMIPVKNRSHHLPLYWLVHFTHHPDGKWWIREAAALASADWRRYCAPPPEVGDGGLFTADDLDPFPAEEKRRQVRWVDQIEDNARRVLEERGSIDVRRDLRQLLGEDLLGLTWGKHLREALARLHADGLLEPRPYAAGLDKYLGRRVQDSDLDRHPR
jgi:three-Cys-motif partner protein